jgi:hypothetical protein
MTMGMTAVWGVYLRELGRILGSSATIFALPAGLVWVAWARQYGSILGTPVDGLDAALRAASVVLAPVTVWAAAPALSAERAEGTATLWAISPVRPASVVAGKLLALITFGVGAGVLVLGPMLWELAAAGQLAWPRVGAGVLGLAALCLLAGAVTLLASALAGHFSTAFAWGLGLIALWVWGNEILAGAAATVSALLPPQWAPAVSGLFDPVAGWGGKALLYPLFIGWVDAGALCGIAAAAWLAVAAAHLIVASERWRG